MTISLMLQSQTPGQLSTVHSFQESRLETVLSAGSLKEACKMNWKEKLQDMCDGGVKKAAITRLYNQITK